ncbi:23S rRNA (pseudouridine(1915)-N(3))-methyltransferase RlmH [bacterium]|jgi:23S rRNA (pseudouridine1915-N3)-methyltransferase|nr:23S rRNA (pseudouridine(1915)-N(3))-methyltransferase RlmH [bacterium]
MKLQIVTVGKLREAYFKAAAQEYSARIQHFLPLELTDVPTGTGESTNGQGKGALLKEADAIEKAIPTNSVLVALDITGKMLSSEQLSSWMQSQMQISSQRIAFVIGGAWGIAPKILERADMRLSLSPMTFPHELAQVILLEQLYRALSLWKGLPYHK